MSSANRGRERNKDDLYETPLWLVEAFIPQVKEHLATVDRHPRIWEPCAGNGRIVRVLRHYFPDAEIIASDIQEYPGLNFVSDFLKTEKQDRDDFDLIISNPPFFLAQEIIQHAGWFINDSGKVAMLERLNFLGSKQREPWLSSQVPDVALSPRRASFLPTRQADSVEYAWLTWGGYTSYRGALTYLDTMTCDECDVHYQKICPTCDYGYCMEHYSEHQCKLFGAEFLWGCANHPEIGMSKACKAKVKGEDGKNKICGIPLCSDCWTTHEH